MTNVITVEFARFLQPAFYNTKKYTSVVAGRRSGKTYQAWIWLLVELLQNPNKSGLWVDTTQRNLTEYVEIYVRRILGPIWQSVKYDKQGHKLGFQNGSFVHLRSSERPENMEGFEYDYIVCNECGIIFRKPELWTKTIMPMAKRAQVKLVGTPKGKNFFEKLYENARLNPSQWESHQFSAYDSPYWTSEELDAIRGDPSINEDIWAQEYLGQFVATTSNIVCKRTFKESWRDDDDNLYTLDHDWIRRQLSDVGYWWVAFDGGMYTTHSAALIGRTNERLQREILIQEIYNTASHEGIEFVAQQAFDRIRELTTERPRLYGDPALRTYGDDEKIKSIFSVQVDSLEWMEKSDNPQIRRIYRDRKTRRLGRLSVEMASLKADHKPAVILLRDGCPNAYSGLFGGQYAYEIKMIGNRSVITDTLDQIPPVTDIVDAFTYKLLSSRPIVQFYAEDDNIYKRSREASLGWAL